VTRCPHLLLSAVLRRRAAAPLLLSAGACCTAPATIDRYFLAGRSAAKLPHATAAVDRLDRRTDGRIDDRYIDPEMSPLPGGR